MSDIIQNAIEIVNGLLGVPAMLGFIVSLLPPWLSFAIGFGVVLMFCAVIIHVLT